MNERQYPLFCNSSEEFVRLFIQHEATIRSYILSLVPRWADAEDIFQETSVRLFKQMDQWNPERDFRAWACTAAYYQVLTWRRRNERSHARFSQTVLDLIADRHGVEVPGEDARRRALRGCIEKLDQDSRQLVDLAYLGESSIQEVANRLNRNVMSVYKTLSRVRMILRDCVQRALEREHRDE